MDDITSFKFVLLLFPGFLTLLIKNGLCTTKDKKDIDKIIEALAYNLLNYTVYRIYIFLLSQLGISNNILIETITIFIISLSTGILIAFVINKGWVYTLLREKIKITNFTGRVSVWNDIFLDFRGKWLLVHLQDGRKLIGWPDYYSEDTKEKELFLSDAAWMDEDGSKVNITGPGIYINGNKVIELIEILD
jgi:hypothetical protein